MKKSSRNYTLCEVTGGSVRRYGKTSKPLKPFPITAQRFAAARAGCFLTIEQTAKLLRVSERTLHNWEAGRVRIPYAAYKLIRILRGHELPGDSWKGYRLVGDTLWSPENLPFHASDARWWSLTVQMAHEYRRQSKARQAANLPRNEAIAASLPAHIASPVRPVIPSRQADSVVIPAVESERKGNFAIATPHHDGGQRLHACEFLAGPYSNTGSAASVSRQLKNVEIAGGAP